MHPPEVIDDARAGRDAHRAASQRVQRQQTLEEAPGRKRARTSAGGLRQVLMHRLMALSTPSECSTSQIRLRTRFHGMNHRRFRRSWPSPASLPAPSQTIRLRSGRVVAQVLFELLEQMLAERRPHAVVEVRLDRVEQQVRKPVVFDDEALVLEAAVREIQQARRWSGPWIA